MEAKVHARQGRARQSNDGEKQPSQPMVSTARTHMAQAPTALELPVEAWGGIRPIGQRAPPGLQVTTGKFQRTFPDWCTCDLPLFCLPQHMTPSDAIPHFASGSNDVHSNLPYRSILILAPSTNHSSHILQLIPDKKLIHGIMGVLDDP